jgi:hypothetical protein
MQISKRIYAAAIVALGVLILGGAIAYLYLRPRQTEMPEEELRAATKILPYPLTRYEKERWWEVDGKRVKASVQQKLREVGGRYRSGKLYDAAGVEIYFYPMYQNKGYRMSDKEIEQHYHEWRQELERLQREHRVLMFYDDGKD